MCFLKWETRKLQINREKFNVDTSCFIMHFLLCGFSNEWVERDEKSCLKLHRHAHTNNKKKKTKKKKKKISFLSALKPSKMLSGRRKSFPYHVRMQCGHWEMFSSNMKNVHLIDFHGKTLNFYFFLCQFVSFVKRFAMNCRSIMCSRIMTTGAQIYMESLALKGRKNKRKRKNCWRKAPRMKKSLNACA